MFYKDKISIIVPAYNVQESVEYCIESILKQSYEELEIILVDDGSNDLTPFIFDYYYEKYPEKITVIHSEHHGVGEARNLGIKAAAGEFVGFVDADDTIHKNMYKEMIAAAKEQHSDLVVCDVLLVEAETGERVVQHSINFGDHTKTNYMRYGINLCSPCNKLFKRTLFANHSFPNTTYEDMAVIPALVSEAASISFVEKHFYNYNHHKGSISTSNFRMEDWRAAIVSSIQGVCSEYRDDMSYWQARSIIDLANGPKEEYCLALKAFVSENPDLFAGNKLIENDAYTARILEGRLMSIQHCAKRFDVPLTIVSDLDADLIRSEVLKNISESKEVQILPADFERKEQIRGEFLLCLNHYVELPVNYLDEIRTMNRIYGTAAAIYAVPTRKSTRKNTVVAVKKKPEQLQLSDYIFAIDSTVFCSPKIDIHFTEREVFYYALIQKNSVYVINQLYAPLLDDLNSQDNDGDILPLYQEFLECDILRCLRSSIAQLMSVPNYVQYYVMTDLRKLFETDYDDDVVRTDGFRGYRKKISYALSFIDDNIIQGLKRVTPEHMLYFFNLKYQKEADLVPSSAGLKLVHNGRTIWVQDNTYTMFEFCDYENGELRLEGRTICLNITEDEELTFFAVANAKIYIAKQLPRSCSRYCLGDLIYKGIEFEVRIPIEFTQGLYHIKFFYIYRGKQIARKDIRFGKFFPLTKRYATSYYKKGDRVLTYDDGQKSLCFRLCGRKGKLQFEKAFLEELKTKFTQEEYGEIARLRRKYLLHTFFSKRRIWLVSDKMTRADDNGEAFFKYMNSTSELKRRVKTYYLLDKSSPDYKRMKKYGSVVQFNSFQHKLLSLTAEYHFIAYANDAVTKPLLKYTDCFKDIMRREWIVFLQHGPTQNNISSALNKYNQNFHSILTINKEEHDFFLTYDYFYRDDQIKLVGFPRYDYLQDENRRYITFAPTWRRELFGAFIHQEERYVLKDGFKESDYYKFYTGVINSPKLRDALKRGKYELHFIPHPVFFPYMREFDFGSDVVVHGVEVSYNQMFRKSSMFITDYSSAVFDCAYLEKPVVYTQFDPEDFYKSQYERGMFDYETEGFGPVVATVKDAVDTIIKYLDNDCKMEEKYRNRVLSYFKYHDHNNGERIFRAFY